jgi:hypothetical protein
MILGEPKRIHVEPPWTQGEYARLSCVELKVWMDQDFVWRKPEFMYCIFIFCLSGDNDQTFGKPAAIRKSPRPAAKEAAEVLMRGLLFF